MTISIKLYQGDVLSSLAKIAKIHTSQPPKPSLWQKQ